MTLELLPDYSLINAEVYLNFTVQCILQENTLDILSQVEDRSLREVEGLPSWVPDYSVRLTDKIIPLIRAKGNNLPNPNRFSAGGQEPPEVNWSVNNPHALKAAGQTLGAIRVVSNPDTAALGLGGCAKEWMSMADALREQDLRETSPVFSPAVPGGSFAPSPSPVEAAYAGVWLERMGMPPCQKPAVPALITAWDRYLPAVMATLGMGYKKSPRLSDKTWEHFLAFLFLIKAQSCSATSDFEELMEQDEISEEYFPNIYRNMEPYLAIIKGVVAGRRIALTENADICFVPKSTNVGDEVCVLKGARTPYILRPLQGSGDRYQFVGEAFIRSRMGGEGLTDVWTSFVLE